MANAAEEKRNILSLRFQNLRRKQMGFMKSDIIKITKVGIKEEFL